jgi:hypothetical protein
MSERSEQNLLIDEELRKVVRSGTSRALCR